MCCSVLRDKKKEIYVTALNRANSQVGVSFPRKSLCCFRIFLNKYYCHYYFPDTDVDDVHSLLCHVVLGVKKRTTLKFPQGPGQFGDKISGEIWEKKGRRA